MCFNRTRRWVVGCMAGLMPHCGQLGVAALRRAPGGGACCSSCPPWLRAQGPWRSPVHITRSMPAGPALRDLQPAPEQRGPASAAGDPAKVCARLVPLPLLCLLCLLCLPHVSATPSTPHRPAPGLHARSVTDEQYRELLEGVVRYKEAFSWERHLGGRAFDYTIASLRRRWLNSLSLY